MPRARDIKPSFFKNEDLAELDPKARLLFIGLWCLADREGRLCDRPKRIKAELFPYEECNIDGLLTNLHNTGFIIRYNIGGAKYIQVVNFLKYQNPYVNEKASDIPPAPVDASKVIAKIQQGSSKGIADADPRSAVSCSLSPVPCLLSTDLLSSPKPDDEITAPKETKGKVFDDDSPPMVLAERLKTRILENLPNARVPKDLRGWCGEIDKMIRLDKRDPADIEQIIDWAQADDFWKANIMSGKKLREKFDRLTLQKQRGDRNRRQPIPQCDSDDDWIIQK